MRKMLLLCGNKRPVSSAAMRQLVSAGLLDGPVSISFGREPSIPDTDPVVFVGSFDCWLSPFEFD